MAFSMAGGGPSRPQINVTPLIDVLLTLIIMFMLVVSMDPEYGEKAQIPQPNPDQTPAAPQPRTAYRPGRARPRNETRLEPLWYPIPKLIAHLRSANTHHWEFQQAKRAKAFASYRAKTDNRSNYRH